MSEKTINYGAHLNLAQKELRNVVLQPLATDPTSGRVGQMYFNTATNKQRFCVAVAEDGTPTWKEVGGGGVGDLQLDVTYAELKALRDAGTLVKGMKYRITDYTCTTTQADTQSAGNVFDIIVTADSESVLNENARAALHEGDTYFADCKLEAWKLKYAFDNDKTRFKWADSNGKGVIFFLKDEFNNEAFYDFKNIQFKGSTIYKGVEKYDFEENGYYYTFVDYEQNDTSVISETTTKLNKIEFNKYIKVNVLVGDEITNVKIGAFAENIFIGESSRNIRIGFGAKNIYVADSVSHVSIDSGIENINIEDSVENVIVKISNIDVAESNKTYEPGQVFAGTSDEPAEATENNGLVTKSQLDKAIAAIPGLSYKVVSALPTSDISKSIIYLVQKATAGTQNAYEEYLNTTGTTAGWEKIGDTEIDLSEYVTATALADALALKQNSKYVGTITGDGSTKEFVITHNLGSQDCIASLRDTATNEVVFADVEFPTANTATVGFADAPKVGENYKITII